MGLGRVIVKGYIKKQRRDRRRDEEEDGSSGGQSTGTSSNSKPRSRRRRGSGVRVVSPDVERFARDMRRASSGKDLQREIRKALKDAAGPIKNEAQARAAWSTRIPAAVAIGTTFRKGEPAVFLRVNSSKAPHARAYENGGQDGTFRHPVFGGPWVNERARPFFFDAAQDKSDVVEKALKGVVDDYARRKLGFR